MVGGEGLVPVWFGPKQNEGGTYLEPLVVAVRGVPAQVDDAEGAAREAEDHGHGVVVAYSCNFRSVGINVGGDTMWVFPQYPAHDVNVVDRTVVEDST